MLTLTRRTEYALIAVCHLARADDRVVSARDIAAKYPVPRPLLMNVLKTLSQAGFVRSVRGARGGYRLALPAKELTLKTLVEAVEGPWRLVRCVPRASEAAERCELSRTCPIRAPVHKLHQKLRSFLDSMTIAELALEPQEDPRVADRTLKVTAE